MSVGDFCAAARVETREHPHGRGGKNKIRQKSAFPPLPNGFSLGLPFPSPSPPLPIFRRRLPCRVFATALITPFDALNCSDCSHATSEPLLFCSEFQRATFMPQLSSPQKLSTHSFRAAIIFIAINTRPRLPSHNYLHRKFIRPRLPSRFLYCEIPLSILLVSGFLFT